MTDTSGSYEKIKSKLHDAKSRISDMSENLVAKGENLVHRVVEWESQLFSHENSTTAEEGVDWTKGLPPSSPQVSGMASVSTSTTSSASMDGSIESGVDWSKSFPKPSSLRSSSSDSEHSKSFSALEQAHTPNENVNVYGTKDPIFEPKEIQGGETLVG